MWIVRPIPDLLNKVRIDPDTDPVYQISAFPTSYSCVLPIVLNRAPGQAAGFPAASTELGFSVEVGKCFFFFALVFFHTLKR